MTTSLSHSPGPFTTNTSYSSRSISLHDETDYLSDAETLITRPSAAYTSSPYVFDRHPTLPGPLEQLTPPPSPTRKPVQTQSQFYATAANAANAANLKLAPFLSRAGSVLSKRTSASSSPTRSPLHSSRPVSPAKSATSSSAESGGRDRKSKAGAFADFFQFQGDSAPMSFGLVQVSPKRETLPAGSVFGPPIEDQKGTAGMNTGSPRTSRNASPRRPAHVRRGSTLATAASFLGLGAVARPTAREKISEDDEGDDEEDPILEMDLESELLRHDAATSHATLLTNSTNLFLRIHTAYRSQHIALRASKRAYAVDRETLAEQNTRARHLKRQLETLAERVAEKEAEVTSLQEELAERDARARTILMVDASNTGSQSESRERFFSAGSVPDECASSSDEGDLGGAASSSRPSSGSSATTAEGRIEEMPWRTSMAPFLVPEEKAREESLVLKRRVAELEEIVNGCLGLVDA